MKAYIDVDWVVSIEDRKNNSGGTFLLGDKLVSWLSKKWDLVFLSTTIVEYIANASCCTQVMWMKQTLKNIKVVYDEVILIMFDNNSAINISKNLIIHSRTEHISIKYHFLSEKITEKGSQIGVYFYKGTSCRHFH